MSFSNWMENKTLNHIFGKSIYNATTMYVGLCTANPGEGATGGNCNEVNNANGYARVAASSLAWSAASGGIISNVDAVEFPVATGGWGVATHFVLCNYGSYGGGNVIAFGSLAAARNITQYSRPRFDPGELSITVNGGSYSFSNWMENVILNHIFGKSVYSPQTLWVGLCMGPPGEGSTGGSCNEMPNTANYSRVQTSSGTWSSASNGVITNVSEIVFSVASSHWGWIRNFVLVNSGAHGAGNVLFNGDLPTDFAIQAGDYPVFQPGALDVSLN